MRNGELNEGRDVETLLNGGTSEEASEVRVHIRVVCERNRFVLVRALEAVQPGCNSEICDRQFIAYDIIVAFELLVENLQETLDFFVITLDRVRNLLPRRIGLDTLSQGETTGLEQHE